MVKRIRLSADDITYYTLPGSSGEISNEAGELPDTIFGQEFQSNHPGLIGWQVQANAVFKGFAGYEVLLKITGSPTAMTDESMTLVTGKTYQIDDATKRILARTVTITVEDNAVPVAAADIESYDYLFGKVTFVSSYTPTGPITISGSYLPTTAIAGSKSFTLTQTADAIDETTIPLAQANNGHMIYDYGLKTVAMDITGLYALSNGFRANLISRNEFIVEISPDNGLAMARGYFRFTSQGQSGDVGALEEETINLVLSVPDDDKLVAPFAWDFDDTSTVSQAIKTAVLSWQNKSDLWVIYQPDGENGVSGKCVATDISLSGGLESMNEFTVNLQGSGALTAL